jgi:uncharacterized protein YajQ (UPF0234 family)
VAEVSSSSSVNMDSMVDIAKKDLEKKNLDKKNVDKDKPTLN